MAHIKFTAQGVFGGLSERTKTDGTKYAVIDLKYTVWGLPGECFTAKLMCFTPAVYNALSVDIMYHWKGIVTFIRGNTFLTVTEVTNDYGEEVFLQPEEYDKTGEGNEENL